MSQLLNVAQNISHSNIVFTLWEFTHNMFRNVINTVYVTIVLLHFGSEELTHLPKNLLRDCELLTHMAEGCVKTVPSHYAQ